MSWSHTRISVLHIYITHKYILKINDNHTHIYYPHTHTHTYPQR